MERENYLANLYEAETGLNMDDYRLQLQEEADAYNEGKLANLEGDKLIKFVNEKLYGVDSTDPGYGSQPQADYSGSMWK